MRMSRSRLVGFWVTAALLGFTSMLAHAQDLKKASFRPAWVPQAQFAGYYTALAKGFYREAGIDLEIRPGGPGISALENVAAGKDTFGAQWLLIGVTLAAKGAPIVNIAQTMQTSGLMLIAFKETGIADPKQMDGKTVGVWPGPFSIAPSMFFEQLGIRPQLASQRFSMEEFLNRKIDVASAMIYNEYHLVLESGVKPSELNTFALKDYGLSFAEDGIYVQPATLRRDPDLCRGFVKASIRGWQHAFEHPEEAVSIVMEAATEARTGTTREHQTRMLEEIRKMTLFRVGPEGIGDLDPKDFASVLNALQKYKLINKSMEFNEFHQPMYKGP